VNNILRIVIAAIVVLSSTRSVFAQERPGAFYFTGGVTLPYQDGLTEETYVTYVTAPGGTTIGWSAGAGVFASKAISIEGEVLSTGMMTAREPSRYDFTYNEERRDRFMGGNVRFHLGSSARVHLEPLVGLTMIRHEGWVQSERRVFVPVPRVEIDQRREKDDLPNSLGLTAGADLCIGGRFAVIPSFRFITRLKSGTSGDFELTSHYPGGFPRYTISGGLLARLRF
jgi:hypothetical protein